MSTRPTDDLEKDFPTTEDIQRKLDEIEVRSGKKDRLLEALRNFLLKDIERVGLQEGKKVLPARNSAHSNSGQVFQNCILKGTFQIGDPSQMTHPHLPEIETPLPLEAPPEEAILVSKPLHPPETIHQDRAEPTIDLSHRDDLEYYQENISTLLVETMYHEVNSKSINAHLYGFYEQIRSPEKVCDLLKRVQELSKIPTSYELFRNSSFGKGIVNLKLEELISLRKALEWVKREGVMSHFDLSKADHQAVFLISDPTQSEDRDLSPEERALRYQLTSQSKLEKIRAEAATSILESCKKMGIQLEHLVDLPAFGHALGLKTFLRHMGTLDGESRYTNFPHLIDTTTANLLVLAKALEAGVLEHGVRKDVLVFKRDAFWIYYKREKLYENKGFFDIPMREDSKKNRRLVSFY
jgi:hypothetical protein